MGVSEKLRHLPGVWKTRGALGEEHIPRASQGKGRVRKARLSPPAVPGASHSTRRRLNRAANFWDVEVAPQHSAHTRMHTHSHTHMHSHTHTCTCMHSYTHALTHVHTYTHAHALTHMHMHMHSHTQHTHTHTHAMHTHKCTHMHSHTHTPAFRQRVGNRLLQGI